MNYFSRRFYELKAESFFGNLSILEKAEISICKILGGVK